LTGGTTWTDFGALAGLDAFPTAARVLEANANGIARNDRIRYVPNPDTSTPFDTQPSFTFQAWDETSGLNPIDGTDGGTADATLNGGTTAFSSTTATTTI